jgi:hypothetical protein
MSCCGDNWIVPGANPFNLGNGVVEVSSGTNTTVTGTRVNPVINANSQIMILGNSASTPINLTTLTITEIIRLTFTLDVAGIIIINGCATMTTLVNQQHDITYYCEINGTMISSAVNYTSIQGTNHYASLSFTGSTTLSPGNYDAIFYVITDAGTDDTQVLARNLNAVINLS